MPEDPPPRTLRAAFRRATRRSAARPARRGRAARIRGARPRESPNRSRYAGCRSDRHPLTYGSEGCGLSRNVAGLLSVGPCVGLDAPPGGVPLAVIVGLPDRLRLPHRWVASARSSAWRTTRRSCAPTSPRLHGVGEVVAVGHLRGHEAGQLDRLDVDTPHASRITSARWRSAGNESNISRSIIAGDGPASACHLPRSSRSTGRRSSMRAPACSASGSPTTPNCRRAPAAVGALPVASRA